MNKKKAVSTLLIISVAMGLIGCKEESSDEHHGTDSFTKIEVQHTNEKDEVAERKEEFEQYEFNLDVNTDYAEQFSSIVKNAQYITSMPEGIETDQYNQFIMEFSDDVPTEYRPAINQAVLDNNYNTYEVIDYVNLQACDVLVIKLNFDYYIFIDKDGNVTGYRDSKYELESLYPDKLVQEQSDVDNEADTEED